MARGSKEPKVVNHPITVIQIADPAHEAVRRGWVCALLPRAVGGTTHNPVIPQSSPGKPSVSLEKRCRHATRKAIRFGRTHMVGPSSDNS